VEGDLPRAPRRLVRPSLRGAKWRAQLASAKSGDYVREDVLDLVPHSQKNHDDDNRYEDQDQCILDHSLAALAAGLNGLVAQSGLTSFLAYWGGS